MVPRYDEDPQYWWEQRGNFYIEEHATEEALDTETISLYNIAALPEVKSVLEVGCGYGRLLRPLASFKHLERVAGFDFSNSQLENAKKYLEGLDVVVTRHNLLSDHMGPCAISHQIGGYDLVFTHGVFTHIPPFGIKEALTHIKWFVGKYIVLIEFELREGHEVKILEGIRYNEIGQHMAAGDTDTWAYDFEGLLERDMELEQINISRNFKTSPFGYTTYIYRKKAFYEVVSEMEKVGL